MKDKTILAVDVGGTKILIGEVDMNGKVLTQVKRPSDITSQPIAVAQIIKVIDEYLQNRVIGDIQAISIDTVGRVNSENGIWYEIDPTIATPIDVAKEVKTRFKLPCYVINDLAAATVAENLLGIGNVTKNFHLHEYRHRNCR
jgi:Transcriptional regulator/sugar kinase